MAVPAGTRRVAPIARRDPEAVGLERLERLIARQVGHVGDRRRARADQDRHGAAGRQGGADVGRPDRSTTSLSTLAFTPRTVAVSPSASSAARACVERLAAQLRYRDGVRGVAVACGGGGIGLGGTAVGGSGRGRRLGGRPRVSGVGTRRRWRGGSGSGRPLASVAPVGTAVGGLGVGAGVGGAFAVERGQAEEAGAERDQHCRPSPAAARARRRRRRRTAAAARFDVHGAGGWRSGYCAPCDDRRGRAAAPGRSGMRCGGPRQPGRERARQPLSGRRASRKLGGQLGRVCKALRRATWPARA